MRCLPLSAPHFFTSSPAPPLGCTAPSRRSAAGPASPAMQRRRRPRSRRRGIRRFALLPAGLAPRPPPRILVEYGIDFVGRPLVHTYVPTHGDTSAFKEPEAAVRRLLSDLRVREDGELIFDDLSKHLRLPTVNEMASIWDFRQGDRRDQVQQLEMAAPSAAGASGGPPGPPGGSSGSDPPPSCKRVAVVSALSFPAWRAALNWPLLLASQLRRSSCRRHLPSLVAGEGVGVRHVLLGERCDVARGLHRSLREPARVLHTRRQDPSKSSPLHPVGLGAPRQVDLVFISFPLGDHDASED